MGAIYIGSTTTVGTAAPLDSYNTYLRATDKVYSHQIYDKGYLSSSGVMGVQNISLGEINGWLNGAGGTEEGLKWTNTRTNKINQLAGFNPLAYSRDGNNYLTPIAKTEDFKLSEWAGYNHDASFEWFKRIEPGPIDNDAYVDMRFYNHTGDYWTYPIKFQFNIGERNYLKTGFINNTDSLEITAYVSGLGQFQHLFLDSPNFFVDVSTQGLRNVNADSGWVSFQLNGNSWEHATQYQIGHTARLSTNNNPGSTEHIRLFSRYYNNIFYRMYKDKYSFSPSSLLLLWPEYIEFDNNGKPNNWPGKTPEYTININHNMIDLGDASFHEHIRLWNATNYYPEYYSEVYENWLESFDINNNETEITFKVLDAPVGETGSKTAHRDRKIRDVSVNIPGKPAGETNYIYFWDPTLLISQYYKFAKFSSTMNTVFPYYGTVDQNLGDLTYIPREVYMSTIYFKAVAGSSDVVLASYGTSGVRDVNNRQYIYYAVKENTSYDSSIYTNIALYNKNTDDTYEYSHFGITISPRECNTWTKTWKFWDGRAQESQDFYSDGFWKIEISSADNDEDISFSDGSYVKTGGSTSATSCTDYTADFIRHSFCITNHITSVNLYKYNTSTSQYDLKHILKIKSTCA